MYKIVFLITAKFLPVGYFLSIQMDTTDPYNCILCIVIVCQKCFREVTKNLHFILVSFNTDQLHVCIDHLGGLYC